MIDSKKILSQLKPLIPYVSAWGEGDDYDRERKVEGADTNELLDLINSMDSIDVEILNDWLCGPESLSQNPSEEYVAFTNYTMSVDSAKAVLAERGLNLD